MNRAQAILLAVLASVAANAVVAWSCAALSQPTGPFLVWSGRGWPVDTPQGWPSAALNRVSCAGSGVEWSAVHSDDPSRPRTAAFIVSAGWPFRAFTGWQLESAIPDERSPVNRWALDVGPDAQQGSLLRNRLIPMRPTWGLAANTAILAAPVVGLIWLSGLRRRRRLRLNLCLACGHQLAPGQSRCPECSASPHSA